jgi:probable F420-dependent oxidoreductase
MPGQPPRVRIGFVPGVTDVHHDPQGLAALAEGLEARGFDSLWLAERVTEPLVDPVVGLAFAAARTTKLKLGPAVLVLPGRPPALVAKQLASLDRLSSGRLLPAFGLGIPDPRERQAFDVPASERGEWCDEAIPLIRRFWSGEPVTHQGLRFSYDELRVTPRPAQEVPDVWLGGRGPRELRRTGRLGDGWLGAFETPESAAAARRLVEESAAEAGRSIDPGHFGVIVLYGRSSLPERLRRLLERRLGPDRLAQVVPVGLTALRERLEGLVEAGISKFVVGPGESPESWPGELDALAEAVLGLQDTRLPAA